MNLTKLFDMQKELDAKIVREKGLEGQDLLPQKILALQVELGECANEWRGFKFWSTNQEPKKPRRIECEVCGGRGVAVTLRDVCPRCEGYGYTGSKYPLLEEYVDCLHFILSIGNDLKARNEFDLDEIHDCVEITLGSSIGGSIVLMFSSTMDKVGDFSEWRTSGNFKSIFSRFVTLGKMLSFSWEEIEQAYCSKNEVNHQRQATGY